MNEEIKEILDNLIRFKTENDKMEWSPEDILTIEDVWLLLDYITNLQQKDFESQKEITKLKDKLEQQRKEYQDTYKDVRIEIKEKNERITNLQQLYENGLKVNQNSHKYITELEMNNAILKEDLDKANDIIEKDRQFYKCRMDEYVELKKENEFLKLNNPEMNIEHFRIVKENKRKIDNLRKENERLKEDNLLIKSANKIVSDNLNNYKSRCEKANEYMKEHWVIDEPIKFKNDLLNILNGSDEND